MRAVLCNLMIAVVTVPALLGWCCHPCFDGRNSQAVAEVSSHDHCCGHHDHEAQQQPMSGDSCSHCKGICNYVLTSKLHVERPDQTFTPDILPTAVSFDVGQPSASANLWDLADLTVTTQPSLRIHAIHQLWLI